MLSLNHSQWFTSDVYSWHLLYILLTIFLGFLNYAARFSPDDKFSRQRVLLKKRFGLLPTQQPPRKYWKIYTSCIFIMCLAVFSDVVLVWSNWAVYVFVLNQWCQNIRMKWRMLKFTDDGWMIELILHLQMRPNQNDLIYKTSYIQINLFKLN